MTTATLTQNQLEQDAFVSWLCAREKKIVGQAGTRFGSPLVEWLSTLVGYQCTIENALCGWMSLGCQWHWLALPTWCVRFQQRIDGYAFRPLNGDEALDILVGLELAGRPATSGVFR
jgi:hypothetical protein